MFQSYLLYIPVRGHRQTSDKIPAMNASVLFLAAFLAVEGLVSLAYAADWATGWAAETRMRFSSPFLLAAQASFCLLLAAQVYQRTRQGRMWTLFYLATLIVAAVADLVVLEPAAWPDLSLVGRAQFAGALALRVLLVAYLLSWRGKRDFVL